MDSYEEYSKRARLMADVHGRTTSVTQPKNAPEDDRGVLSASDNKFVKTSDKKKPAAGVAKKLSKKKSLKRL